MRVGQVLDAAWGWNHPARFPILTLVFLVMVAVWLGVIYGMVHLVESLGIWLDG